MKSYDDLPDLFCPQIMADFFNVSLNTAYSYLKKYDIPQTKLGRKIYIDKELFLEWLDILLGKVSVE